MTGLIPRTWRCDVCGLVDPYNGQGDGIGSCDCPRCDGDCGVAANSVLCDCPDDDGPACWALQPGGGARCGLDVDHEGEHQYSIWQPLEDDELPDPGPDPYGEPMITTVNLPEER